MNQVIAKILNNKFILAHISYKKKETLFEHTNKCLEFYDLENKIEKIDYYIKKSFENLQFKKNYKSFKFSQYEIDYILKMKRDVVKYHDVGKANLQFQVSKMNNDKFKDVYDKINSNTTHSMLSSALYIDTYLKNIENNPYIKDKKLFKYITLIFANCIYCHHNNLNSLEDNFGVDGNFYNILCNIDNINFNYFYNDFKYINEKLSKIINYIKKYEFDESIFYIVAKITYSSLVRADFIATSCFIKNQQVEDFIINKIYNIEDVKNKIANTDVKMGIEKYKNDKNYFKNNGLSQINELRSEIAIESNNILNKNKKYHNIYNIKAPTGSGKTFNSLICTSELLNDTHNKIVYTFPINAISNQTKDVFQNIFQDSIDVVEINSNSEIPLTNNNIDYDKILLNKQLMNYPFCLTSNINLFNILFSTSREYNLAFNSLFNSIIVLDEIQNYKNNIWKEFIEILYKLSKILNFKIIIMSATLPNLQELIDFEHDRIVNLTPNSDIYFNNRLFKDRVEIDTELLHIELNSNIKDKIYRESLYDIIYKKMIKEINYRNEKVKGKSKFLIEFISKNIAREFNEYVYAKVDKNEYDVYELDSDDNIINRNNIINICKEENRTKNLILITTQVIEAGVDIDMDLGAKDISFVDLDEQFLGRINRSCKKKYCKAFFFNLIDASNIYRDDLRNGINILDEDILKVLYNKNFDIFYKKVFNKIELINKSFNDNNNRFYYNLKINNYKYIEEYLKLIENNTITVFIPSEICIDKSKINGYDAWEEYCDLVSNFSMKYSEKRIKLHNIAKKLNLFSYNIYDNPRLFDKNIMDNVNGIYYLDNKDVLTNHKLDFDKFLAIVGNKNGFNFI